jgi:hypothetical protein
LKWVLKNFVSRNAADDLLNILKKDFNVSQLRKINFKSIKNEWKRSFYVRKQKLLIEAPSKKTKFGEEEEVLRKRARTSEIPMTLIVKFTLFSISHILSKFLETPLAQTSIITSSSQIENDPEFSFYQHPCSAHWFSHFEQECKTHNKLPLALVLFFDPFEAIHNISRGALIIGVMNVKTKVLLSPYTKLPIGLIPNTINLDGVLGYFIEQLVYLEKDGVSIKTNSGVEQHYMVRVAYAAGDSKDLNAFVGIKGANSLFGCRMCWISHNKYTEAPSTAGIKTKDQILNIHRKYHPVLSARGKKGETKAIFHNFSMYADGLSEMFLLNADFMLQSPADILHNEQLGCLADEILHIFEEKIPKKKIPEVFDYFGKIIIPKGSVSLVGRLESMKNFRGNDWHTLACQLPIVLTHLNIGIGTDWYDCFIIHLQYYFILSQKSISKDDLNLFSQLYTQHHNVYKDLYPQDFIHERNGESVSSNRINFHLTNHWPVYIQLFGAPMYFSLEVYEHAIKILKKSHKNTNGKNPTEDVLENFLQLSLGVICDQTYQQFTAKDNLNKVKWPKKQVKDPQIQLGEKLMHWNTLKLHSSEFHSNDTIILKSGQIGILKEIWADKLGDFASVKLKVQCYDILGVYKNTPVWSELKLTEKMIIITPYQLKSKIYAWEVSNTMVACSTYLL